MDGTGTNYPYYYNNKNNIKYPNASVGPTSNDPKRARETDSASTASTTRTANPTSGSNSTTKHADAAPIVVVCHETNMIHHPASLPQPNDVLLGHSDWPGTVYFEQLLERHKAAYQNRPKSGRPVLVNQVILQVMGKRKPPARFFLRTTKGDWIRLFGRETISRMVHEAMRETKDTPKKKPKLSKEFLYNMYMTTEYTTSCGYSPTSIQAFEMEHRRQIDLIPSTTSAPPQAPSDKTTAAADTETATASDPPATGPTNAAERPRANPNSTATSTNSSASSVDGPSPGTLVYRGTTNKSVKRMPLPSQPIVNGGSFKRDASGCTWNKAGAIVPDNIPRGVTQRPSGKWVCTTAAIVFPCAVHRPHPFFFAIRQQAQIYFVGQSRYLGVYKECVAAALAFETAQNFLKGQKKTINEMFSRSTPKEEAIRVFALARKEANRQVVEQLGRVMLAD